MGASLSAVGFVCGVFILGALFARLFIGRSIERIGMKKSLYLGMFLFIGGILLNLVSEGVISVAIVRFLQGIGFGITSTATGVIMAHTVPEKRRGEGTSYYAMFVTMATAIGPFAGIYFYGDGEIKINLLVSLAILLAGICAVNGLKIAELEISGEKIKKSAGISLNDFFEVRALPMAFITLLVSVGFASILGFITTFEQEKGLLEAGKYFFVIYAVFTVCSRPITGKLFDIKGENFVMYPSFVIFGAGLLILSVTGNEIELFTVAACMGLGFGTYMSCAQAIIIKLSPKNRIGLATSTFFIFMDLGVGFGPLILGFLIPIMNFEGLYVLMGLLMIFCALLYRNFHGRKNFQAEY